MNKKELSESRVVIENGEVKTIYSEEIRRTGYMSVEEFGKLLRQSLTKQKEIMSQQNAKITKI